MNLERALDVVEKELGFEPLNVKHPNPYKKYYRDTLLNRLILKIKKMFEKKEEGTWIKKV